MIYPVLGSGPKGANREANRVVTGDGEDEEDEV